MTTASALTLGLIIIALSVESSFAEPLQNPIDCLANCTSAMRADEVSGIASTYNPLVETMTQDHIETASGEPYDPNTWAAAIRTDLRGRFGGIKYGRSYRAAYALVEWGGMKVVVKINDVGPLKPGRIIDLNDRTMRYFDPDLRLGLIPNVVVTPLAGDDWVLGPLSVSNHSF